MANYQSTHTGAEVDAAVAFGMNPDSTPTVSSTVGVTSGGVKAALDLKQDALTFDSAPVNGSANPVTSDGLYTAFAGKQNTLTFDSAPMSGSNNPVKSGGIYDALATKQDALTIDPAPTVGSTNPVQSGGTANAIATAKSEAIAAGYLTDTTDSNQQYSMTWSVVLMPNGETAPKLTMTAVS